MDEAEKQKAGAEALLKDPQASEAQREQARNQLRQANAVIAQYGAGSDLQMAIRAVTGALQGLASGNTGAAIVGGLSPYANLAIKNLTQGNDTANIMAHAVLGAIEAQASGNNALAGAAGAATGEATAQFITQYLYKKPAKDLTESEKQTVSALSQFASGLAGATVGNSTQSAVGAMETGKRAVENNHLEIAWDATNLALGSASFYQNIKDKNYGMATLDGIGLMYDGFATVVPFLPAGASAGLKAYRAGNSLKQSATIGADVAKFAEAANKAAKDVNNITNRATTTGSKIHRATGELLGESQGKAYKLSDSANSYVKGANSRSGIQPDISWSNTGVWGDLTTKNQWSKHINSYSDKFGNTAIPIIYEPGKGVVNSYRLHSFVGTTFNGSEYIYQNMNMEKK